MRELLIEALSGPAIAELLKVLKLPESYREQLKDPILDVALWIFQRWKDNGRSCFVAGVTGAQGTGKSTLTSFLKQLLEVLGLRVMIVGIDDLYLSRNKRMALAEDIHPLFATRGVPGTHEISLAMKLFEQARRLKSEELFWPRFNKATDDRDSTQSFEGPIDIVLFEGWCVACPPLNPKKILAPINTLERQEDPDGVWRFAIQAALSGEYSQVFDSLDVLIMLRAPSFEAVFSWRGLQEKKLGQSSGTENSQNLRIMNDKDLRRFIQHYERLTRHMLDVLPPCADVLLDLDDDHRIRDAHFA
ncbi:MAG: hypothetical protein P1V97_25870 [Planctomycetota bacterium]|nr:hypothetical protein [Planctomycetota bacterium]